MTVVRPLPILFALLILSGSAAHADADGWIARRLPWYSLPHRDLAGVAPVAVTTPSIAWNYGAASDRLEPFAAFGPVIVRVVVKVESGAVGVSMMNGDGSAVISKEKLLTDKDGQAAVYFRVDPGSAPRIIVLRNPGRAGVGAMAEVESVDVARVETLPADEMARVNLGLL